MTNPDYATLIDAETWDFIRHTARFYPEDAASYDVARQREVYDRMCLAFTTDHPPGVQARDRVIAGVPTRVYESGPATATVVYAHGGAMMLGGLESHDNVCAEICAATGYRVIATDYRLMPEHDYFAGFHDVLDVTRAVAAEFGGPIVLVGDSAGGKLVAAVAGATLGEALGIRGQVLIYPGLGGVMTRGSYVTHAQAPMLSLADLKAYETALYPDGNLPDDPAFAPLWAASFAGLPPTLVFSAECDPLSDDGRQYCDLIAAAGGRAHWINEAGLVHGYLRARHGVARARDSFARITAGIAALGRGEWPYQG